MSNHLQSCVFGDGCIATVNRLGSVDVTHPGPFSRPAFDLLHCTTCDVVYLDPTPTADDLRVLYQESDQFTDPHYTDEAQVRAALGYYGHCLDNLNLMPEAGHMSLEVGAGLAWMSRAIKDRDLAVTTLAQDVTDECANRCRWVDDYLVGDLTAIPQCHRFQLISLTHVIEHVPAPGAMLATLARHLEPGGRIFVTAPYRPIGWTADSGVGPWKTYSYLHVPAHISYLSERWFACVADRCGLRLEHWSGDADQGQAFEVVLAAPATRSWWKTTLDGIRHGLRRNGRGDGK